MYLLVSLLLDGLWFRSGRLDDSPLARLFAYHAAATEDRLEDVVVPCGVGKGIIAPGVLRVNMEQKMH